MSDPVQNGGFVRRLAELRGQLDDVILDLIMEYNVTDYEVQSWCHEAIDEAVAEKKGA